MSSAPFLTETRERFLKAILTQLPVDRMRELYVFQPIKHGGMESGVAVIAAYPEEAPAAPSGVGSEESGAAPAAPAVPSGVGGGETGVSLPPEAAVPKAVESPDAATAADTDSAVGSDVAAIEHDTIAAAEADDRADVEPVDAPPTEDLVEVTGEGADATACETPVQGGEDEVVATEPVGDAATGDAASGDVAVAPDSQLPTPDEKYTVYTARYRLVLKGPDRGKWEASVVAEADAPLISIESVVRGVQRRAGDVEGPDHMTADDIRAALRLGPRAAHDVA